MASADLALDASLPTAEARSPDRAAQDKASRDGPRADRSGQPLWPCNNPGEPCNPHDPCAMSSVCGADHLCHSSLLMNCDDELSCTADSCVGSGICQNHPVLGSCVLPVKASGVTMLECFKDGAQHPTDPCLACDADASQTMWSPLKGSGCP